jgi:uncharacterized protein YjbI with pentapeptide repeats
MAKPEQVAQLMKGTAAWNAWRRDNYDARFDLDSADFSGANLSGVLLFKASLTEANLSGANLSKANLHDASFRRANLSKANFVGADLREADLSGANLNQANLSGANLKQADLSGANLNQANLSGANLTQADLSGANLGGANLFKALLNRANLEARDNPLQALLNRERPGAQDLKGEDRLQPTNLSGANLTQADLSGANFYAADLSTADLHQGNLHGANLSAANLSGANLRGADLTNVTLVNTNLTDADLTGCRIFGLSAWGLKLDGAKQQNLIITGENEPEITVDHIEVAQFVYLMLHNEKIRDVIDTITSKVVLILGRFMDERKAVLDALREELRKRNYLPILFDFNVSATRDITETISLLARMARFVVADITDAKSIPQELSVIVPDLPSVPVQPLLLKGSAEYGMFEHFRRYPWVLETYTYPSSKQLIADLGERVIGPAEDYARSIR